MLTYATRQAVKDQNAKAKEANNEVSMAAIASCLEEHHQAKLDLVHTTVSDHVQKITALEANATLQNEHLITLEAWCAVLMESNAKLLVSLNPGVVKTISE